MGPSDLLARVAVSLSRLGAPYLVAGSMASTAYGEPRFTNDIVEEVVPFDPKEPRRVQSHRR